MKIVVGDDGDQRPLFIRVFQWTYASHIVHTLTRGDLSPQLLEITVVTRPTEANSSDVDQLAIGRIDVQFDGDDL